MLNPFFSTHMTSLADELLPTALRGSAARALALALAEPLARIANAVRIDYGDDTADRAASMRWKAARTPQVFQIQTALNDIYDTAQRRIIVGEWGAGGVWGEPPASAHSFHAHRYAPAALGTAFPIAYTVAPDGTAAPSPGGQVVATPIYARKTALDTAATPNTAYPAPFTPAPGFNAAAPEFILPAAAQNPQTPEPEPTDPEPNAEDTEDTEDTLPPESERPWLTLPDNQWPTAAEARAAAAVPVYVPRNLYNPIARRLILAAAAQLAIPTAKFFIISDPA